MLVYAHRGSSRSHPENTMEAFEAAIAEGADGIETDLRLTMDGEIVLCHDPKFHRAEISSTSFSTLRSIAASHGGNLPSLSDLLDLATGKTSLNLEIKDPAVVGHLSRHKRLIADCLFTSFHAEAWTGVRWAWPAFKVGPVLDRWGKVEMEAVERLKPDAVSLKASLWSPAALDFCGRAGADLLLWVVNDPTDALLARTAGVQGIFTDEPGKITSALGQKAKR